MTSRAGALAAAASRSAIAIAVARSRTSRSRSAGTSGSNSRSSHSRPSASSAMPLGRSRMAAKFGGRAARIEQHQQLQLTFGGAAADDCGREIARPADQMPVALLQGNDPPAHICKHLPEKYPRRIELAAGGALVAGVERRARRDAAGLAVEPGEAPALAAEPADVLVGIAPTGEFPIEDRGQLGPIEQVIAGTEIAMAQHRGQRRRPVGFQPAYCPFEDRPRGGMRVQIAVEARDVLLGANRRQKSEIRTGRPDGLETRQLMPEPGGDFRQARIERRVGRYLSALRGSGNA